MKISIFTPSHDTRYIALAYQSLLAQAANDWEWVVLLNGGATFPEGIPNDERVRIINAPDDVKGVGALKRYACAACVGDVFVELDHDDQLAPDCLAELSWAFFKFPDVGFVYSDTVRFRSDGAKPGTFDQRYGWEEPQRVPDGWLFKSFEPTPQSLTRIWYAPDHVRAWRRSTYYDVGGHDPGLQVCDDYDLLCRTYLATTFHRIPKGLYLYRVGANNTSADGTPTNAQIQQEQFRLGNKYRVRIAETWARRGGLALVDLCSGPTPAEGYVGLDLVGSNSVGFPYANAGEVIAMDLRKPWRFTDSSIGVIRAQDALEHLPDKLHTMNEAHRVLAHGGWFFSDTPSTDGRGAFQDPTHVSYWNSNSFWYYTAENQRKFVPSAPHFQMWHIDNLFYDEWYKLHDIPYVRAHMSAIKDGPRLAGPYDFTP